LAETKSPLRGFGLGSNWPEQAASGQGSCGGSNPPSMGPGAVASALRSESVVSVCIDLSFPSRGSLVMGILIDHFPNSNRVQITADNMVAN